MPEVLDQHMSSAPWTGQAPAAPPAPATTPAERPARRALLDQIERLEGELCSLFVSTWPRKGFELSVPGQGGPRLLSLGELEQLRDELAHRVHDARRSLADRTYLEEKHRRRIEEMLLEPERHKWVRIGNEDIGEPGCKHWHVRPRWGLLGMLMNWWRVRISSGCPLGWGRRGARWPGTAPPMARRRRKRSPAARSATGGTGASRAERDAARRERAARKQVSEAPARRHRARIEDRPPPLWGSFPLTELVTLGGIVLMTWGFLSGTGSDGNAKIAAGLLIASIAGLELAVREHVTGFRSHTTLLSGAVGIVVIVALGLGAGLETLGLLVLAGAAAFAGSFLGLRELFKRRSGGLSFR